MQPDSGERRLAAILSADVVGYSRLMALDESATVQTLNRHREQIELQVRQHGGRVVDATGDDLLVEFASALNATRAAVEIQRVLRTQNAELARDHRMEFRMGLHVGDVRVEDERLYGSGVNVAARLQALSEPGGLCISDAVHQQVREHLELRFEDLGEQAVKNIPTPVRAYRVPIESAGGAAPAAATPQPVARPPRRVLVAAGLLTLAAAAAVWWWVAGGAAPLPGVLETGPIRAIAVLPLENLSGDPEQEYFADGMTDALISDLAQIASLRVISRTSVMRYKRARKPLREIARELDVDALVEGTILRAGNRVRITAQLIDARNDHHIWAQRYEGDLADVLGLQADVSRAIAEQIEIELTPQESARLTSAESVDPEAHEAYLRGLYAFDRSDENHARAIEFLLRAIELDPDYARAHAALASVYGLQAARMGMPESWPLARASALRALEIDPTLGAAHVTLARQRWNEWDWEGAERGFKRALELGPSDALGHSLYGNFLVASGRFDEGLDQSERALKLAPTSLSFSLSVGLAYLMSRRYEPAIEQLEGLLRLEPMFPPAHFILCYAYALSGRTDEAIATHVRFSELLGSGHTLVVGAGPYVYARAGRREEATRRLEELVRRASELPTHPFSVVSAYEALGDRERALDWMERGFALGAEVSAFAAVAPMVGDDARSDPRFQALLRSINHPGT